MFKAFRQSKDTVDKRIDDAAASLRLMLSNLRGCDAIFI
jgi:hypothetical protein